MVQKLKNNALNELIILSTCREWSSANDIIDSYIDMEVEKASNGTLYPKIDLLVSQNFLKKEKRDFVLQFKTTNLGLKQYNKLKNQLQRVCNYV